MNYITEQISQVLQFILLGTYVKSEDNISLSIAGYYSAFCMIYAVLCFIQFCIYHTLLMYWWNGSELENPQDYEF